MTSAIYISLAALLMVWLSLNVIKVRRKNQIKYGDGDNPKLIIARSAHSNAVEYIPIFLLLLLVLEYNQASLWLVHIFGLTFISGRIIHAKGLLSDRLKGRILGMQITLYSLIALAVLNFIYFPYHLFF